ncbi:MAG: hypothetical protein ACYDAR_03485 [Thermomicrobiales bacterium]
MIRLLPEFRGAVLTGRDGDGFPYSIRCQPMPDNASRLVRVQVPPSATIEEGPASLLWHSHDALLWHQKSFLVRGTLTRDADGWNLHPMRLIPGVGFGGIRGVVRFARDARRTADRYLAAHDLARPTIPWAEIIAVKKQARRRRKNGGETRRPG